MGSNGANGDDMAQERQRALKAKQIGEGVADEGVQRGFGASERLPGWMSVAWVIYPAGDWVVSRFLVAHGKELLRNNVDKTSLLIRLSLRGGCYSTQRCLDGVSPRNDVICQ